MAKGLRSKYARRIRSVRRAHYWEVEGKEKLETLSRKLHDPTYDLVEDIGPVPNAFVEPNNPNAVFPQVRKPHIIDFRDHKMAGSGFASRFTFRKNVNARRSQKKYEHTVTTREELDVQMKLAAEMKVEMSMKEEAESDEEEDINDLKRASTIEEITAAMDKKMKISKQKGGFNADAVTKVMLKGDKQKALKLKHKNKRSRSQLRF